MDQLNQLMQALQAQRAQMMQAEAALGPLEDDRIRANTRSFRGLIPGLIETAVDAHKRKNLEPQYTAALEQAMNSAAGYDDIAAQYQQMQAAQRAQEEEARKAQLGVGAGYTPGQAAAVAGGIALPAQEKPPSVIAMLQAAGIPPDSPEGQKLIRQYMMKSRVTVNTGNEGPQVGTIPQGYELGKDPASGAYRMNPIPGGPAYIEQQAAAAKVAGRQGQAEVAGQVVLRETDRALELVNKMHQGEGVPDRYWRAARAKIKGTPEEIMMGSVLAPIKAELSFNRLQTMRENSPTGGALGNVSNFEVDNLQKTAGLFDADMPLPMLTENLTDLRSRFLDTIHGTAEQRAALVEQGVVTPEQNAQIEALYQRAAAPQSGGLDESGQVYHNPQTGERIRWNGTTWVKVQ
jgi:hypothetical protein